MKKGCFKMWDDKKNWPDIRLELEKTGFGNYAPALLKWFFDQLKPEDLKDMDLEKCLRTFFTHAKQAKLDNTGSEIREIICQEKLKNLSEGAKKLFSVLCFLQMGFR